MFGKFPNSSFSISAIRSGRIRVSRATSSTESCFASRACRSFSPSVCTLLGRCSGCCRFFRFRTFRLILMRMVLLTGAHQFSSSTMKRSPFEPKVSYKNAEVIHHGGSRKRYIKIHEDFARFCAFPRRDIPSLLENVDNARRARVSETQAALE